MPEKIDLDLDAIEAAARAATPQDFVSAQVGGAEEGWMECPHCCGEGSVELTADYLNYDGQALGVQFYGIGDPHVHAEAHYREACPAVVVAMVEEIRNLRRALGGMLFAFDDGVGEDWSQDVLDYARQITPAVEFKRIEP